MDPKPRVGGGRVRPKVQKKKWPPPFWFWWSVTLLRMVQIMIMKSPRILQDPFYLPFLHPNPMQPSKVILKMPSQQKVDMNLSCRCWSMLLINADETNFPNLSNGKFVSKPAVLCQRLLHQLNHASTDCLCRVQEVSCFNLPWQWLGWTIFTGWKSGSHTYEVWRTKSFLCSSTS